MCIWFIQSKNNMKHRVLSNLDMCLYCETRQGFKQIMSIFLDSEILWCVSRKAGGAIYFPPEIPVAWTRYWILPCHWQNDRGCAIETSQNYSVFISKKKRALFQSAEFVIPVFSCKGDIYFFIDREMREKFTIWSWLGSWTAHKFRQLSLWICMCVCVL